MEETNESTAAAANGVSNISATTSWFEFILDETLLERHLSDPNADPSAAELIALFLYQADVASSIAREIVNKENISVNGSQTALDSSVQCDGNKSDSENKKIRVLKLLAIKAACFMQWNLSDLERRLPMAILRILLQELLKVVSVDDTSVVPDFSELAPEARFALLLYHRWALITLVKSSFPSKPSKVANVQVPGLLDPSISSANMKDAVMKSLSESVDVSVSILEKFVSGVEKRTRRPAMSCIGSISDDGCSVAHNWENAADVDPTEMSCQVLYDLGRVHFFKQNYEKADTLFAACKNLRSKVTNASFMDVDESGLNGYVAGCGSVLGRLPPDTSECPLTLYQKVVASVRNNFQGLTALLIEDLQSQELSWTFRATLEESTFLAKRADSLYEEVVVCNSLRRALDGQVAFIDMIRMLNRTIGLVDFFIQVCADVHESLPSSQVENLKVFLRSLCYSLSPSTEFVEKLLRSKVAKLLSQTDQAELSVRTNTVTPTITLHTAFTSPAPVDEKLKTGELERELLVTYDVAAIKEIVPKLASKVGNNQAVFLTDKWFLPIELQQCIGVQTIPQPALAMCTHVLIAKARISIQLQQYDRARELIAAADSGIREISFKLSKILRWEMLKVDLLQCIDRDGACADVAGQELSKRCRACVASTHRENSDIQPSQELLSYCVAYLLNVKDWDFLSSVMNTGISGVVYFGQLIAMLCKEVPQLKTARTSANKFLESVSLTFAENIQVIRTNSPAILPIEPLKAFISKIKEPVVLSLFVSCMTKLYNNVCIDITEEIFSDYTALWPTTVPFSPLLVSSVSDMVGWLMGHVLSVNPQHPSWLRTQADIHFAQGNHWQSLRYFLELGIVTTDFFTEPVTKNIYNDQVYHRMIHCCSQLGCHTQVAVLCQFLDEIDYTMAFKAFQERCTHDAADAYYDCIWDTTMLEYLINLHTKRGELDKRQHVLRLMGQMELNSSNREDILTEAARVRKSRFLRVLAQQYLGVHSPQLTM